MIGLGLFVTGAVFSYTENEIKQFVATLMMFAGVVAFVSWILGVSAL